MPFNDTMFTFRKWFYRNTLQWAKHTSAKHRYIFRLDILNFYWCLTWCPHNIQIRHVTYVLASSYRSESNQKSDIIWHQPNLAPKCDNDTEKTRPETASPSWLTRQGPISPRVYWFMIHVRQDRCSQMNKDSTNLAHELSWHVVKCGLVRFFKFQSAQTKYVYHFINETTKSL